MNGCIIIFDPSIPFLTDSLRASCGEFLNFLSQSNVYTVVWSKHTNNPLTSHINSHHMSLGALQCGFTSFGGTSSSDFSLPHITMANSGKANKKNACIENNGFLNCAQGLSASSMMGTTTTLKGLNTNRNEQNFQSFRILNEWDLNVVYRCFGHLDGRKQMCVLRTKLRNRPALLSMPMVLLDDDPSSLRLGGFDYSVNLSLFKSPAGSTSFFDFISIYQSICSQLLSWYNKSE